MRHRLYSNSPYSGFGKALYAIAIVAFLVFALVAALTGCSSGAGSHSKTEAVSSAPPIPTEVKNSVYLGVARDQLPGAADDSLIKIGHDICGAFAQGATWVQQVGSLVSAGGDAYSVGSLIAAATASYCPEYTKLLP